MLVLDTDALWHRPLLDALVEARACGFGTPQLRVVLPVVAFAERVRQLQRDSRPEAPWLAGLQRMGVEVESLDVSLAARMPAGARDDATWRVHARDFLIAAHVRADASGVTSDIGPAWKGIPVMTPPQAAAAVRALMGAPPS